MKESPPSLESKKITRGEVINAYKKLVERGITNPDHLDLGDPEVIQANELFDQWREQEDRRAEGDEELGHRVNHAKTMLHVDAGFTDPTYLKEVLHEWLRQDAQDAKKQSNNPKRVETRLQIAAAMKKMRELLREQILPFQNL